MQARLSADASGNAAGANEGFNNEWTLITGVRVNKNRKTELTGYHLQAACGYERDFMYVHFPDPQAVAVMARELHKCAR